MGSANVPFLGSTDVIGNVSGILDTLGSQGLMLEIVLLAVMLILKQEQLLVTMMV